MIISVYEISEYFLSKDPKRELFNKNLVERNGRKFYEGNLRLNKYLQLCQNIYIAKTGRKLFDDDMYAYDNGAVVAKIQENYAILWSRNTVPKIDIEIKKFLDKIYCLLKNATIDELIEISHEDREWVNKHNGYNKEKQRMNPLAHIEEYKIQYAGVLLMMEHMNNEE